MYLHVVKTDYRLSQADHSLQARQLKLDRGRSWSSAVRLGGLSLQLPSSASRATSVVRLRVSVEVCRYLLRRDEFRALLTIIEPVVSIK